MKLLSLFLSVSISISIAQTDSTNNLYDKDGFIGGPIVIEIGPKPIGGINAIQQEINYPTEALINQLEGRVYVKATIDTLGNVSEVEIMKGIGYGCDEEALHIVRITKFSPAIHYGKKLKCQISIPIMFKLPK